MSQHRKLSREPLGETDEGREMEQHAYGAMWGLRAPVDIVVMTANYFEWMLATATSLPATVQREGRLLHAAEDALQRARDVMLFAFPAGRAGIVSGSRLRHPRSAWLLRSRGRIDNSRTLHSMLGGY